ncbi:unnamed protein product [Lymnaea stagnalis]|uniref:Tyrosine-protein phosphatase domain-containing protein n=1 Tax=Lymnaea stagnalis TaxID=6523 RepID=A0AAV2I697_LYMST
MTTDLDPHKLLTFIKQARSYNALAKGMILYTCRNGARYSGLACVLSLLVDRMEHDSCLTVPLVVGSVKSIRPEVIPTVDQYRVLYDVLQRSTDTAQYGNVGNFTTATKSSDLSLDKDANTYANL